MQTNSENVIGKLCTESKLLFLEKLGFNLTGVK